MPITSQTSPSPVTVHVLGGRLAISAFQSWQDRETEALPDEVEIGFSTHQFATENEAAAFGKGVEAGSGWLGFEYVSQDETSRRVRFGLTAPQKTETFRFVAKAEAEAFDKGLSASEGYSEAVVLDPEEAAEILAAKDREAAPAP